MAGVPWRVRASVDANQVCLPIKLGTADETPGACGPAIAPQMPFSFASTYGGTALGSGMPVIAQGVVREDVAQVHIVLSDDASIDASVVPLAPFGVAANAFATALPPGAAVTAFIAFDANGTELGRLPGPGHQ